MLVVFTGPSLPAAAVEAALPGARVQPPACRGDVDGAVAQGATGMLIIDGGFAHRLAVAPSEIIRALCAGVHVVGAASLGAIRAAECHPAGMRGVGAVQRLYRLRVLTDDDEVAVATEPDRGFRATSLALVNVRFAVLAALRTGLLNRPQGHAMLAAAKRMHFSERLWGPILKASGARDLTALEALCRRTDVKRRDAERAVAQLAATLPAAREGSPTALEPPPERKPAGTYFGHCEEAARAELCNWLTASGRYRRYFSELPAHPAMVWTRLIERGDLDHELMRWYAVVRGVQVAGPQVAELEVGPARAALAKAHGFGSWEALELAAVSGCLPGGVSVAAVEAAVTHVALARRGFAGA